MVLTLTPLSPSLPFLFLSTAPIDSPNPYESARTYNVQPTIVGSREPAADGGSP